MNVNTESLKCFFLNENFKKYIKRMITITIGLVPRID